MTEMKNVPVIRFKGFCENWEDKTLGGLGSVSMNKRIFKVQTSDTGDVPFYKIGTFGGVPDAFIPRGLFEEYRKKYPYPSKGDLLISASGSIGRIVEYSGKDEYFQDSNIVWLEHDNRLVNSFLKQFYSFVKWGGLEGSTIKRLYNKDILDTQISIPAPTEQTQIGSYFQHLDKLISLHQAKVNKLTNLKKAMLEKMFPKQGADVPEIRFKGFAGAWVIKSLSDICHDTFGGGTPKTSQETYWDGDTPWIQSSDLIEGDLTNVAPKKYVTHAGIKGSATKLIPKNSIAIVTRVGIGKLALMSFAYTTSQDFLSLSDLKIEKRFAAYAIWKKIQEDLHIVQGTSIKGITKEEALAKIIKVPIEFDEQNKIGTFFQNLDKTITLHQTELEKLGNLKKACLEKMFV